MRKQFGVLLGLLACLGLLAACGGGGGDQTTETLTKAEFIAQGDAICEQGDKEVEAQADAFAEENGIDTQKPSQAELEEVALEVFAPSLRKQADEIGELGAPEGEEDQVEAMVAALEGAVEEIEAEPSSVFDEGDNPLQEASELASELGFTNCGQ